MPKISVILPVYNGARYIKEAVQSILDQTFADFDLFVIDDGSTDSTVEILNGIDDKRLNVVCNDKNRGLIFTLNRGLELSAGYEYIARMDADDIALPGRLQAELDILENNPKIGVVGTAVNYFGNGLKTKKLVLPEQNDCIIAAFLCRNPIVHPTVMMRTEVFLQSKLQYDPDFYKYEDYKLWIDLFDKCEFYNLPQVCFLYRRHEDNVTNTGNYKLQEDMQMAGKILNRYADKLNLAFSEREIYLLSVITSTYRWRVDINLPVSELYESVKTIIAKHLYTKANQAYLSALLWERVFVYLIKAKRFADLLKLIVKLKFSIDYGRVLKIHRNWF